MKDGWFKSIDEERDLGMSMDKDLKFSKQCLLAKNKANLILGVINRGVSYKSAEVIPNLFNLSSYNKLLKLGIILIAPLCTPSSISASFTFVSDQNWMQYSK